MAEPHERQTDVTESWAERRGTDFTPLSQLIRQGFEDEVGRRACVLAGYQDQPSIANRPVEELPSLMRNPAVTLQRQGEILAAVIGGYRRTPTPEWSALLLEMVSPMLVEASSRFTFLPVGVNQEDIHHQLIAEALHVARFMALPDDVRGMQKWLRRRALRRTAQALTSVIRSQGESLEEILQDGPSYRDPDQRLLMELEESGVSRDNLRLLYSSQVLGMTVRELAIELGVSDEAVRSRQRRALRRLSKWSPSRFRQFSDAIPTAA
jgi:DNA-directed RNA polymerase specialized sigma24 family protein